MARTAPTCPPTSTSPPLRHSGWIVWLLGSAWCLVLGSKLAVPLGAAEPQASAAEPAVPAEARPAPSAPAAEPDQEVEFFRARIEPVLVKHCYDCHSGLAEELQGGLRVDSRAGLLQGGDSGPALVPGKPGESLLLKALRHEDGYSMPPKKPRLPDAALADFARWIDRGAVDPRQQPLESFEQRIEQARDHWAFRPVVATRPPAVQHTDRVQTPLDNFLLARLEARGWNYAPPAPREVWLRRVSFDLIGLPPTAEDVAEFAADQSATAYQRVVDRLLDSPQYGQRWAQHWLDVVRFAETEGYEYDRHVPDAWRYRDYVIRSLNADKPWDQFLREQLAGDEQDAADQELRTAAIFHRLGPVRRNAGNPDIALSRNEVLTERTDILGTAILGLTLGCARCHNHKLEPISQQDYYRLQAYLAATAEDNLVLASAEQQQQWQARTDEIKEQIKQLQQLARPAIGEERAKLDRQISDLEDSLPASLPTIPSTSNDMAHRTTIHVLRRGVWEQKGVAVGPRPPSVLVPATLEELPADVARPRTQLAQWLTSPENPLVARVLVNRLWQDHFGTGLVATANDFGTHGDPPSHPELLDYLASELVRGGWRLKPLHRLLVLSAAYQQGTATNEAAAEWLAADPDNRLLWQFSRRRLSAEELRDAMLAVSGRLNLKAGGPSIMTPVDPDLVRLLYKPTQWQVAEDAREHDRRSIYLLAKRNLRLPFYEAFDAPALTTSCPRRQESTHAPQALELLNGTLSNDLAQAFAQRLMREAGSDSAAIVRRAYALALSRPPTDLELRLSVDFLRTQPLSEFALALFNLNGFLYVR